MIFDLRIHNSSESRRVPARGLDLKPQLVSKFSWYSLTLASIVGGGDPRDQIWIWIVPVRIRTENIITALRDDISFWFRIRATAGRHKEQGTHCRRRRRH